MPKKYVINTLYYLVFALKIARNPLKKCDLVQKMLGKSVCAAYLCERNTTPKGDQTKSLFMAQFPLRLFLSDGMEGDAGLDQGQGGDG